LEVDALDFASGSMLLQYGDHRQLHSIAICSRKFFVAQINYKIYDKELLAIINVFKE